MANLSEILGHKGGRTVELYVREHSLESQMAPPEHDKISQIDLIARLYIKDDFWVEIPHFLAYISPGKREKRSKSDEKYNLDYLMDGQTTNIERGYELFILTKALNIIANIDPCIKGIEPAKQLIITKLGERKYDLNDARTFYKAITEEYYSQEKARKASGQFCWPFAVEHAI